MKLKLVAATAPEISPALRHFGLEGDLFDGHSFRTDRFEVEVCITGAGMIPSTFALTKCIFQSNPDFVLQAGIGGAFDTALPLGSIAAVSSEQLGDTGAEDHDRFIDVFDLGFANGNESPFQDGRLINELNNLPVALPSLIVPGITVSTVSGYAPTIAARSARYQPVLESMEGAALHYVCLQAQVPFLQVRGISNHVTPRDRSSWQIGKAVKAVNDYLIAQLGHPK